MEFLPGTAWPWGTINGWWRLLEDSKENWERKYRRDLHVSVKKTSKSNSAKYTSSTSISVCWSKNMTAKSDLRVFDPYDFTIVTLEA